MSDLGEYGRLIGGSEERVRASIEELAAQPIDQVFPAASPIKGPVRQTTIGRKVSITGPGTFFGKVHRTLVFEPSSKEGWRFDRTDLPDSMPIQVSARNIWTTVRNIVLSSGSPHNYMRMVEHIVALKLGMGLDNLTIRMDSGDPPLFDRGSMDLVEAVETAGIVEQEKTAAFVTVREPVTMGGNNGSFLTLLPAEEGSRELHVDCAINFNNAIGKQRISFTVTPEAFRHGALARTNTNLWMMLYCKTIGKIFADVRHLGYTKKNILVAGPKRYINQPGLMHNGKSLEAVWHRASLDLLAALALIEGARFAGKVISYKSGHSLDTQLVRELYNGNLLQCIAR